MPKRKNRTGKQRLAILEAHGCRCYLSGATIDPVRDRWEIEHVVPLAGGGEDVDENCRPVLASAHKAKTLVDLTRIAKGKRVSLKHMGAKQSKTPLPGGRNSPWKRKMNGTWVRRDEE